MAKVKLRAWEPINDTRGIVDDWEMVYTNPRGYDWPSWSRFGDCILDDESFDHAMVMQWIWLKDKNGMDIYEGDILKGNKPFPSIPIMGDHSVGLMMLVPPISVFLRALGYLEAKGWDCFDSFKFEVVGNMYEDPKLYAKFWNR